MTFRQTVFPEQLIVIGFSIKANRCFAKSGHEMTWCALARLGSYIPRPNFRFVHSGVRQILHSLHLSIGKAKRPIEAAAKQ